MSLILLGVPLAVVVPLVLFCGLVSAWSQGRWSNAWAAAVMPGVLVVTAAPFPSESAPFVVGVVFALATAAAWAGVLPAPTSVLVSNAVGSGVVVGVALATSRFVADLAPLAAPVVMALVISGSEVLGSRASPFGEWGSLAHTQVRRRWALAIARRGPHVVTAALVLVSSAFGFAFVQRSAPLLGLALAAAAGLAVAGYGYALTGRAGSAGLRVAGVLEDDELFFAAHVGHFVATTAVSDEWWSSFGASSSYQQRLLLERTRAAGVEGADLVVWAEGAGLVAVADHDRALEATAAIARSTSTYIVASWMVLDRGLGRGGGTMDNVCTVFDASGEIVLTTAKRFPVPGPEADRTTVRSQGDLQAVETPFGGLAVRICFDADHAECWRQIARSGADVVAVPASDWPAIGPLHADMARLRARSVAAAIVRPARSGVSIIATPRGGVIARQDHRDRNAPALRGTL